MSAFWLAAPTPICSATTSPPPAWSTRSSSPDCAPAQRRPMAELVGIYAASHGPLIARDWDKLPDALKQRLGAAYGELGRRIGAARVDTIVGLAPDHWTNFFLDNLPALCIGIGESHDGPPEPFMRDFAPSPVPGDAVLGQHILETALAGDFEPALSYRLRLDHGLCLPLSRMALRQFPRIVPILINELEPPMLSYRRCFAWGRLLRDAIASFPEAVRVAILATGGLSHSIGAASRLSQEARRGRSSTCWSTARPAPATAPTRSATGPSLMAPPAAAAST